MFKFQNDGEIHERMYQPIYMNATLESSMPNVDDVQSFCEDIGIVMLKDIKQGLHNHVPQKLEELIPFSKNGGDVVIQANYTFILKPQGSRQPKMQGRK